MAQQRGSALRREDQERERPIRGQAMPATMKGNADEDKQDETQGEPESDEREQARSRPVAAPPQRQPVATSRPGSALQQAINRAQDESQTIGGRQNPNMQTRATASATAPASTTTARRVIASRPPLFDASKLTEAQVRQKLEELLSQQQRGGQIGIIKAIRFNNGAEPNVQQGEIVSARDTGSISVYGFARRPLTLYAGQWVALARYMPDLLNFLKANLGEINEYVAERLGNRSKWMNEAEVDEAIALFCLNQGE